MDVNEKTDNTPEPQEERVWHAGSQEPMPIRELPEAPPSSVHVVGPAMILVALGVGLGETYMWPRLVILFGPDIRWLFLIGVTLQAVVMMEMARYAMATGESIFFGAARVWKPLMWLFFVTAIAVYIWPGHMSAGADALEFMTGIPWLVSAIVGMILIGIIFSVAGVIYNLLETLMSILMGILVIGSAIVAAIVGSWAALGDTLSGLVAFGYFPDNMMTATWFPVVVGSIAFAGPSGMQQMWYTLWLRDKGAGMGSHLPKIKGLVHADEAETMPSRGFMFDTEDETQIQRWKAWQRWVRVDAILLFWGITMLVTIIFTIMAMAAAAESTDVVRELKGGDSGAAQAAMAHAFASAGGEWLKYCFFSFICLVGFKGSMGIFDAFSRGQADMTYFFVPGMRKFKMQTLYFAFLWGVVIFGILILLFGPADGPTAILDVLAFLSTFAMGAYCVVIVLVNNLLLPKQIRPHIILTAIIAFGAVFYLGMLFYSIVNYGIVVS